MNKKVTILTPCYNTGKYLPKYIQSIIDQHYSPIQLIMVNDGSTDATESIILSNKSRLEEAGIDFLYIKKENGGAASAISYGLKYVNGEYLVWPDSDDWLLEGSISKRVDYLEKHCEIDFLRCNGYNYNEKYELVSKITKDKNNKNFIDFLLFNIPWSPGCYMVRWEAFKKANPDNYIYFSNVGQNIQMMLPIAFKNQCYYFDEYVYGYLIRAESHSHKVISYEEKIRRLDECYECVFATLDYIGADEKYKAEFEKLILEFKLEIAWKNGKNFEEYKRELQIKRLKSLKFKFMCFFPYNKFTWFIVKVLNKITHKK